MGNPGRRRRRHLLPGILAAVVTAQIGLAGIALDATPALASTPVSVVTAEKRATAEAQTSGTPVVVDADTTAYSQTVANPDGSFTLTSDLQPQRVHRSTGWVPVDASLHANADGTLSPAASVDSLVLSGGGTTPLARFSDGAGHSLSVSMPMTLPTPTVSGPVATYPAVLPGVDLQVTAGTEGGIGEVLIVKNAAAAANPALASLRLSTATTGLTVAVDARGAVTATDPATKAVVFSTPPSAMWDSAGSGTSAAAATASRTSAADAATTTDGDQTSSDADGPGVSAHVTAVPAAMSGSAIVLTPPATALTGSGVTFPVYIDPSVSGSLTQDAYVESNHSTTTHYKPSDNLRVGYDDWTTNCGSPCYLNDTTRTYLHFTGISAMGGAADVTSAILQLTQIGSPGCSGNPQWEYLTAITPANKAFSSSLDWDNQPGYSGTQNHTEMDNTNTGRQFNIPNIADYMARQNYTDVNLVIWAATEAPSGDCNYRHFATNPTLSFTFYHTPNAPSSLKEVNGGASIACSTTSPGSWVTKATNNQVTLAANVSTPDAGTALTPHIYLSTNGGAYTDNALSSATPPSGGSIGVSKAFTLTDGSTYSWYAKTVVTADTSVVSPLAPSTAPSSPCYFRYDGTTPDTPTVTSTDYPAAGPTGIGAGQSGTFTIKSADGGTNPSGLAKISYALNGTGITSGSTPGTLTPADGSATLTLPLSQLHWGTNTLWTQAADTAGNQSAVTAYTFYIQQAAYGPYTPGTAGDINGDSQPDLVTVDAAGNIRLFSSPENHSVDPGTTDADPLQYGGAVLVDHSVANRLWPYASFAGTLVAHAGSFQAKNYDDLIVQHGDFLDILANPGGSGSWTITNVHKPTACAPGCTSPYNGVDTWSNVTQMIAVPTGAGQAPDLLTVENYKGNSTLWLYPPTTDGTPGFGKPTMINTSNGTTWSWNDQQLLAAGKPTSASTILWARDLTTGALYSIAGITAPITGTPTRVTLAASGYGPGTYPMISTVGQPDPQGNLPFWATTAAGDLLDIPASTTSIYTPKTANTITGWATHEVALGSTSTPYNSNLVADNTGSFQSMDGTYAYSDAALNIADGAQIMTSIDFGEPNCRTWTEDCTPDPTNDPTGTLGEPPVTGIIHGGYQIVTASGEQFSLAPSWTHQPDNYAANGQLLPAPICNCTGGYASHISILGAANQTQTVTATITYTDGHTQQTTFTLDDWTNNTPTNGTTVITAAARRKAADGTTNATTNHIFATTDITLNDNGQTPTTAHAQIATIKISTNTAAHIFAIGLN